MVKADLSRDYYGDLELPANADANDIKKQFKKLGTVSFKRLPHSRCAANSRPQLCSTTQTATLAARAKSLPNSKESSLRMRSSLTATNAPSTIPTARETSIGQVETSEATLGPTYQTSSPRLPKPQRAPVPRNLPHHLRELSDISTLTRPDSLRINRHRRAPTLDEAPMKHGRG